jgi:hypothetical protein
MEVYSITFTIIINNWKKLKKRFIEYEYIVNEIKKKEEYQVKEVEKELLTTLTHETIKDIMNPANYNG